MESLATLVAGVAHSINNVLTVAMGTASLREKLATDPADLEAYQNIGRVCRRGREVVRSLIHFAQPTLAPAPTPAPVVAGAPAGFLGSTNVVLADDDEDVRFLGGLQTPVHDGDTVTVLPAVAGGAC